MLVGEEIEPEAQDANAVDGEPQGYQEWSVDNVVKRDCAFAQDDSS